MVAELLGPEKAVIGMTFIPGESLQDYGNSVI